MSLFQELSRPAAQNSQQRQNALLDPMQKLQELRRSPAATLAQAGLQIPENLTSDQEIADYLVQSGQVPPALYNRFARMLGLPPTSFSAR